KKSFGTAYVTEAIRVLVLNHFAHELCAAFAESGEQFINVLHCEHDAKVTESIHWGIPVISNNRRREKSREFDPAVAIRCDHHGDLDVLVSQTGDAPGPFAFDRSSPFELQAKLGEKRDGLIEVFDNDANIVHPQ